MCSFGPYIVNVITLYNRKWSCQQNDCLSKHKGHFQISNLITLLYWHYMDQLLTSTANFIISIIFKDQNFNLFRNSSVFYIYAYLICVPEDGLQEVWTLHSVSGFYVKVHILLHVDLFLLSIKWCRVVYFWE